MKPHSSVVLLAALGVLAPGGAAAAEVDTSDWKCESCPYPKGSSGTIAAGVGAVTQASQSYGDFSGLQRKGGFVDIGGTLRYRGEGGYFADLDAADLGLDSRRLDTRSGRAGLYSLTLGYAEVPRHFADGAATPYAGVGGNTLTLPAGYPAPSTAQMPLATTLNTVTPGFTFTRLDLGGTFNGVAGWSFDLKLRRDRRDGTRPSSGSFFASAAQLLAPVNQTTDHIEASAAYAGRGLQARVAYQVSMFRNGDAALTWDNPFTPVVSGATRGQIALAPANQFHQVLGSAGYDITPSIRASANLAAGRLTQDGSFVAATLNPTLATPLPASSLDGRVDTFNGSVRLTATVLPVLRLNASYARDVRQNRTAIRGYTLVDTDMFAGGVRSNTPFTFKRDRLKLGAEGDGPKTLKLSGGLDIDRQERSYAEVVRTHETTVWGRATLRPRGDLSLALRLAHGERARSTYGTAVWFVTPENPLLRRFNLAQRWRDTAGVRAEYSASEKLTIGTSLDYANDEYPDSAVGLRSTRSLDFGVDVAASFGEHTQLTAYLQSQRMQARQAGSQQGQAADWTGLDKDRALAVGLTARHAAMPDRLDIGASLAYAHSRNDLLVQTTISDPGFPAATTARHSATVFANYKLKDGLWIDASLAHEKLRSVDWHLDGVGPDTVSNLLALGTTAPRHELNVLRAGVRWQF